MFRSVLHSKVARTQQLLQGQTPRSLVVTFVRGLSRTLLTASSSRLHSLLRPASSAEAIHICFQF